MKLALLAFILVTTAVIGDWVYRSFFRPIDPLQPEVLALAEHFNRNGINVTPYAVRHGFKHSEVVASAALQIDAYPLPISIDLCPNEVAAESFLHTIAASPNLMHPQRNQRLVMYLPMWGNDTDAMAAKVKGVFSSFQPKPH
jgi:hypothetical protein